MWQESVKNLGKIRQNTTWTLQFSYLGSKTVAKQPLTKKPHIVASCGCTTPIWDPAKKLLSVSLRAGEFPAHLKVKGYNSVNLTKKVTVNWEDGTSDILKITFELIS